MFRLSPTFAVSFSRMGCCTGNLPQRPSSPKTNEACGVSYGTAGVQASSAAPNFPQSSSSPGWSPTGRVAKEKASSKYALGRVLGHGGTGVVYKCREKATRQEF